VPVVLALLAAACVFGPSAAKFEPARGPHGVTATITTTGGTLVTGELIEVRDTGLLVAHPTAIVSVPYTATRSAAFAQTTLAIKGGQAPAPSVRERLRLLSRFPQGLSAPLLQQLLAARGQAEVTEVVR
jgi:hypothetical protein